MAKFTRKRRRQAVSGDRWVAAIGNDQNVVYRVEGTGDLRCEEPTCLYRADGIRIRCGTVIDTADFGIGVRIGGNGAATGAPRDLTGLSDAELSELVRRAGDEVAQLVEG